jgi:hypothetical protein
LGQVYRYVRTPHGVPAEKLFDHAALIAAANYKFVDTVGGVNFHDMPENRQPPYFDHRFWSHGGLFSKAGTEAAGKNYSLHDLNISLMPRILFIGLHIRGSQIKNREVSSGRTLIFYCLLLSELRVKAPYLTL